jgi:hypothetical protein
MKFMHISAADVGLVITSSGAKKDSTIADAV